MLSTDSWEVIELLLDEMGKEIRDKYGSLSEIETIQILMDNGREIRGDLLREKYGIEADENQ